MNSRNRSLSLISGLVTLVLAIIVLGPKTLVPLVAAVQKPETFQRIVLEAGGHQAVIRNILFTADGRELVSIGDDKTIRIWSVSQDGKNSKLARTIRGQIEDGRGGQLFAAALSPPNASGRHEWLAVGGYLAGPPEDRDAIRLHDYTSGEVRALLKGHSNNLIALAFSPTGRWLASAGKDQTILIWDMSALKGQVLDKAPLLLKGHTDRITDLAWSAAGDRLASASYDGTVGLWNTAQLAQEKVQLVKRLEGHDGKVRSVAFHPNGAVLASGGQDRKIRLWQASDGKSSGVLARAEHFLSALAFSPNGQLIVAGNFTPPKPKFLSLFTYPKGKLHQRFRGHDNLVIATAFHPSGHWLASGGGDHKEILLWSATNGEILSRLEGRGRTIYAVGFSKDGRYFSWGQKSKFKSIIDRGPLEYRFDLTELERLEGGLSNFGAIRAKKSSGKYSLEIERGELHSFNSRLHVKKGRKRYSTIERNPNDGYWHSAYTFTADGQGVLSGGQNGVLRLYTLDAKIRAKLLGHTGEIKTVAVSSDGRWALSGSNDQTIKLWNMQEIPASDNAEISPSLTLFPTVDGEWIAWTPDGYFAASDNGARQIGYSVNQGIVKTATYVSVDQLYDRFYRPDLVYTMLHGDPQKTLEKKEASIEVKEVIAGGLAPRVAFVQPTANRVVERQVVDVHANVMDQGGGIGKVIWQINGTTVVADSYGDSSMARLAPTGSKKSKPNAITLKQQLSLLPGENTIELIAYNRRNEISSTPVALTLTVKPPPAPPLVSRPLPEPKTPSEVPPVSTPPPVTVAKTAVTPPKEKPTPKPKVTASTVEPSSKPSVGPPSVKKAPEPAVKPFNVKPPPESVAAVSAHKPKPTPSTPPSTIKPTPEAPIIASKGTPSSEPAIAVPKKSSPPSASVKAKSTPASSSLPKTAATAVPTIPAPRVKKTVPPAPSLHLLVVGVNLYRDKALRLKYAVQDGQAIMDTIRQTAGPLFHEVKITHLFDDQVTLGGLERTFRELKERITTQDVFMLYLAGHGVTLDGRYYFLPQDFRYYNDEALRSKAINQDHLQRWLASIPARKSLVLIDTCESGSFSQSLVAMRGMAEKTAIAKLTRATGRATIVASTDEQPAAEGYQGHGVFTYVLLQGLRHADSEFGNRDGYTGLFELAAYVNDQVPSITMKAFNFEQIPQVHMLGTDFPIGVVSTTSSIYRIYFESLLAYAVAPKNHRLD